MQNGPQQPWIHTHQYNSHKMQNERRTLWVILLTVSMMVVEIAAGSLFGSMALLADGWHMGTHGAALGITLVAYIFARRLAADRRFAFGSGKISILGGFSSAVVLLLVALLMAFEAAQRLFTPRPIQFDEAIGVAVIGLCVNLFSAFLLKDHEHEGGHEHQHQEDYNLKAAYLHVLADALTSILAIVALVFGKTLGWVWMDALMGLVGAAVITRWSVDLMRRTGGILLDRTADEHVSGEIRDLIESDPNDQLVDLHLWKINADQFAAALTIVSKAPKMAQEYRARLEPVHELAHLTVEVHQASESRAKLDVV